jgi:hypothetical protein
VRKEYFEKRSVLMDSMIHRSRLLRQYASVSFPRPSRVELPLSQSRVPVQGYIRHISMIKQIGAKTTTK